jgi:recombination associated protein RdgC
MVNGTLPADYGKAFSDGISRYAFRNLDEQSDHDRTVGWVSVMDMFDSSFEGREFFREPYLSLTWRIDVRRVPPSALKQHCREAENEIKAREELDFLPKARRLEIRQMVQLTLLKRAIPSSKTYDMVWNLQSGAVLFGCLNNRVCDEFREFFLKTFGLNLASVFPYGLAFQACETAGIAPDMLDGLDSVNFTEDQ